MAGKISAAANLDLGIILANLLEQIFESVELQPENLREVFINLNDFDNLIILEISAAGNSLIQDTAVIDNFAAKYAADFKIARQNNFCKIFISWREKKVAIVPPFKNFKTY